MSEAASTTAKIEHLLLPAGVHEHDRATVERSQRRRLQLSLALLARERGYELASIDEIAECARLSKSTLYEHFRGREELLGSAVEDFLELISGAMRRDGVAASAVGRPEWPDAVREAVDGLCRMVGEEPELARLTFVEGPAVFGRDDRTDPSESVLRELLGAAGASAADLDAPPALDGVQWRALNGAFKSALQDWLRRGDRSCVDTEMSQSLAYLIIVAHGGEVGEIGTEGVAS